MLSASFDHGDLPTLLPNKKTHLNSLNRLRRSKTELSIFAIVLDLSAFTLFPNTNAPWKSFSCI